ncbi:histidine kinase N-terminal 7TM domain-containing protein [Natrinema salinisoli]|uniref:histidine kinase N-terminal 7TM domain-containing protein n=1 Tax=Natrinema salinisoli TaxID=2878535 RepID=UPI001CEFF0C3|nr:histidine kinase N-terminal 7TM domain-containing protein [Natrinema salinisoli]
MEFTPDLGLIVYFVATAVAAVLTGVVWRHREKSGATWLTVGLAGAAFWAGTLVVRTMARGDALAEFMARLLYVGVGPSVLGTFLFVLAYSGREHLITRKTVALLSIEPVVLILFAFVNPGNLFFKSFDYNSSAVAGITYETGIAFDVHVLYSYGLSLAGMAMIIELLYNSRALYRGQAGALLGATMLPVLLNAIHIFDIFGEIPFDTTPVGFILSGTMYAIAIVRYRLVDIVPIARDRVLDNVTDGVFVVDTQNRLIDINPVAREMLEDIDESPIGASLDSLLEGIPELRDEYHELTEHPVETDRELALFGGHYHIRATPIEDGRDRHAGWLLIVRDITERKRREAQLQRQNERLERFADLVSHDLRNPLNVADGYLDLAREDEDPEAYLDEIERSHERMETIIEDVLALAREGADVTDPVPVSLTDVAERAWNGVATGEATIEIDTDGSILADPNRTARVFENLFRNSIEHGTEPGDGADLEITVGTLGDAADGSVEGFFVADDGRGFPDEGTRVFEEGYTADDDGTGFGLSIVEEIATAHGWTVDATESEAGGARFEFTGVEPVRADRADA